VKWSKKKWEKILATVDILIFYLGHEYLEDLTTDDNGKILNLNESHLSNAWKSKCTEGI